jgi:hypothetical protein
MQLGQMYAHDSIEAKLGAADFSPDTRFVAYTTDHVSIIVDWEKELGGVFGGVEK